MRKVRFEGFFWKCLSQTSLSKGFPGLTVMAIVLYQRLRRELPAPATNQQPLKAYDTNQT